MAFNIIVGFVVPWIFGLWLYSRDPFVVLTTAPVASIIAFFFNMMGMYLDLWTVRPRFDVLTCSSAPADMGLYPVLAAFLIKHIHDKKVSALTGIVVFALGFTLIEGIGVAIQKVVYHNGWGLSWTFVSYLVSLTLVYLHHRLLEKYATRIERTSSSETQNH